MDHSTHSCAQSGRQPSITAPSRPSFRLTRAHALSVPAVAPFKNLLPGFTTPECEAELRLDGAADSELDGHWVYMLHLRFNISVRQQFWQV